MQPCKMQTMILYYWSGSKHHTVIVSYLTHTHFDMACHVQCLVGVQWLTFTFWWGFNLWPSSPMCNCHALWLIWLSDSRASLARINDKCIPNLLPSSHYSKENISAPSGDSWSRWCVCVCVWMFVVVRKRFRLHLILCWKWFLIPNKQTNKPLEIHVKSETHSDT